MENNRILWTDTYRVCSKTELLFFTQYERDIDKFKPSRSGFLTGIYRDTWLEQKNDESVEHQVEEWHMYELEDVLAFIKNHPIKAYVYSGAQIRRVENEVSGLKCLKIFIEDAIHYRKNRLKNWLAHKIQLNASMRLVHKLGDYYYSYVIVRSEEWSPRIEIMIRRKNVADADFKKYEKLENMLYKFDDKWFNAIELSQYDYELSTEKFTKDEIKEDKKLMETFIDRLDYFLNDTETSCDLIWCNCKELLKNKTTK